MKLILLFGPPAVGKLTVAKELQKITGLTLFHNHIVLNAVTEVFDFDSDSRRKLEKEFRQRIVEEAVLINKTLIMTGAIMKDNLPFYQKVIQTVRNAGGEVVLVQLTANKEELQKRLSTDSRKELKKFTVKEDWEKFLTMYPEMFEKLPGENHMTIDTSSLSVREVAEKIVAQYHL